MTGQTTVLITGAKTGIGKGLLAAYASRPNTTVIAAIRDGLNSTATNALKSLPVGSGSSIIVASYDASSSTAAQSMVQELAKIHGINTLDIVIANAGILKHFGPAKQIKSEELLEHFTINTVAPILLYQSTEPLLNNAKAPGKFIIISSNIGSNSLQDSYNMPMLGYGLSKAGVNYAVSRMHREEARLIVLAAQPGWVRTAMGEKAAGLVGMSPSDVPVTLQESVAGLMALIDKLNKEEHSGRFFDQTGKQMPW
jgi:norsolorinic acid ketoreductase